MILRYMGIDPGLANCGWAFIDSDSYRHQHLAHGEIKTSSKMEASLRLHHIYNSLKKLVFKWKPQVFSVEELFFARNVSSALDVAQVRGVCLLLGAENESRIYEASPAGIKMAVTGQGRADKDQVREMIRFLLGLKEKPASDHAADALAAAICAAQQRYPNLTKL